MSTGEPRWRWLSTQELHRGWVRIEADEVELPGGERTVYEVDRSLPYSVATFVLLGDDVLLSRQYRYAIDRWILDLPGGGGSLAEPPEEAARRELEEEIGLIAQDLTHLHTFSMNPGRHAWPTHLFFATAVRRGHAAIDDPAEQVRLVRMPLGELDRLIAAGEILDPALLVARGMGAARGLLPPLGA